MLERLSSGDLIGQWFQWIVGDIPPLRAAPCEKCTEGYDGKNKPHEEMNEDLLVNINAQQLKNATEIFVAVILDLDFAALISVMNRNVSGKATPQLILNLTNVSLGLRGKLWLRSFLGRSLAIDLLGNQLLRLADIELLFHDYVREQFLLSLGLNPKDGLGVTGT